jgi:hypothetical protein
VRVPERVAKYHPLVKQYQAERDKAARALLKALGYQPDAGGTWRLGTSRRAIARRANWTKAERNMG